MRGFDATERMGREGDTWNNESTIGCGTTAAQEKIVSVLTLLQSSDAAFCMRDTARRMSPALASIKASREPSLNVTLSCSAMCCSRDVMAEAGSGEKRNFAQREVMGSMMRLT